MDSELASKIMSRIAESPSGCWLWGGAINSAGYGKFYANSQENLAHRLAYELWRGPIPDGKQIDHLCRVRNCVNPAHMEPVTQRENIMRGVSFSAVKAALTHCKRGHPFAGDNLKRDKKGHRVCRECDRIRKRKK